MEKPEQWSKAKEIFAAALDREPSQRTAFLRDACGRDESLLVELESLLSAYESSGGLSKPSWSEPPSETTVQGKSVGPYQLLRKLGEGGMGQVWLAEQTSPVRRQVALKLVRVGLYDESVLRRFQSERQALAIMDHPSIAKVFDAGTTADGQPYFVMEYVPGLPITDYCDKKKLKISERLELFIQACEGVQHAHQKAVIHRDLKPANILVVEVDGKPMPRIIDFGLAKATTPQVDGQTLFTQIGSFVGTPGYISPEQADPSIQDVDTRTDVYSLGVVLYELLTGSLPFDTKQKRPVDEILRQLREEDPPRPSTKVSANPATSAAAAAERGTEPKQLVSELRGDPDWITMKAVERERGRRYGTPSELAADVRRYLNHEPIEAHPASAGYRVQKYVRRHRVAVGVAAGLALLLAGFAVVQTVQLRRITRERERANRITNFMTSMFKVSDPSEARGNSITVREILDKAANEIDTGLAKDAETQAQMLNVMGEVYFGLGLYPRAESLLARALDMRRAVLGPEHPDTLTSMNDLGMTLVEERHYLEAEKLQREALAIRSRVLGPEHPDTLSSMRRLANALSDQSRFADAEKLYRKTLEIQQRVLGAEHRDTLGSMDNLAWILTRERHFSEAEKLQRDALNIEYRVEGTEHPDTLSSMNRLAYILSLEGQYPEAEKVQREGLDIQRRVLGAEHPHTLRSMMNLVGILSAEGHYAEAEKMSRETHAIQQRVLGPEHPATAGSTYDLGSLAALQGRREQAL